MISNAEIKRVKALQSKKFRDESGLFVVEGEKMVAEALESALQVEAVYRRDEIGEQAMARISSLNSPSPVLAVVRQAAAPDLDEIRSFVRSCGRDMLAIALDEIRDPGNLGTIIRLADWYGIDAVFCSAGTVELYNPKVVQSTMGAIFRKKVIYCDLNNIFDIFASNGLPIYGTFLEGEDIYRSELSSGGLIVMGNEANGISPELRSRISAKLFIPPYPGNRKTAESLNVAIATAITVSEFRRRR